MKQNTETASTGTMLDLVETSSQRTLQQIIQLHIAADFDTKLTLLFRVGSTRAEYLYAHDADHFVMYKFTRLGTKRASLKYHKSGELSQLKALIGPGWWRRALNYGVPASPARIEQARLEHRVEAFIDDRCADLVAEPMDMPAHLADADVEIVDEA
jgi:hypothetical protein